MNHKRGKPKNSRAGCLMCKPHKANGCKHWKSHTQLRQEPADKYGVPGTVYWGEEETPKQKSPYHKDRPYILWYRWIKPNMFKRSQEWSKFGTYTTYEIAEKVMRDDARKCPNFYEYKIEFKE